MSFRISFVGLFVKSVFLTRLVLVYHFWDYIICTLFINRIFRLSLVMSWLAFYLYHYHLFITSKPISIIRLSLFKVCLFLNWIFFNLFYHLPYILCVLPLNLHHWHISLLSRHIKGTNKNRKSIPWRDGLHSGKDITPKSLGYTTHLWFTTFWWKD